MALTRFETEMDDMAKYMIDYCPAQTTNKMNLYTKEELAIIAGCLAHYVEHTLTDKNPIDFAEWIESNQVAAWIASIGSKN